MTTVSLESPTTLIFQQLFESFGPYSRELLRSLNLVGILDRKADDVNSELKSLIECTIMNSEEDVRDSLGQLYREKESLEKQKLDIIASSLKILRQFYFNVDHEVKRLKSYKSLPASKHVSPLKHFKKRLLDVTSRQAEIGTPFNVVNPNEPTYCICHQFSYGEMVACDNQSCAIEWFHFGCVGLSEAPKGKWCVSAFSSIRYCEKCSATKRKP